MEFFSSYSGSDFLVFYVVMLLTCVAAGLWIPANLRPQGKRGEVDDLEEVAVLTGGADRLNVAVLSSLFAKGALESGEKKRLRVKRSEGADGDAERAVLAKVGDFTTSEAHKSIAAQAAWPIPIRRMGAATAMWCSMARLPPSLMGRSGRSSIS